MTFYPLCPGVGSIVGANLWDIPGGLKLQLLQLQVVTSCGDRNNVYVWWWGGIHKIFDHYERFLNMQQPKNKNLNVNV